MKKHLLILILHSSCLIFHSSLQAQWSELGGMNSLNGYGWITSIYSDASGNIYAGGPFTRYSGSFSDNWYVAKWDGTTWSELGGLDGLTVDSCFIYDDGSIDCLSDHIHSFCSDASGNIYAGGWLLNSSGNYFIAKWDGTAWSELGGQNGLAANSGIQSICSDASGNIYAVGWFANSSGNQYVAKWDGTAWSELGGLNGLAANSGITSVCSDASGNIYVGGYFINSSGNQYVAKWDGIAWSELGGLNGLAANNEISSVCSDASGNIYAAGDFTNSSGFLYVAKWDETVWSELGELNESAGNDAINSVCSDASGNIYAGGGFTNSSGYRTYVAKWDGAAWSELGGSNGLATFNGDIFSVCSDPSGNIYAGGSFYYSPQGNTYVAKYNVISCPEVTDNFSPNPLTHVGTGSSYSDVTLAENNTEVAFTIAGLGSRIYGNPHNRYIERVTVNYINGSGATVLYGVFRGDQVSTVNVSIGEEVQSVTLTLDDAYDGNSSTQMRVSMTHVISCANCGGCPDADGDGVFDADDYCPGYDDNLIGYSCDDSDPCTENDVFTINCDCEGAAISGCGCTEVTDNFSPNPLTHVGTGSSNSDVTLAENNTEVAFTISGLGSHTNGNPNNRYIERVTVNYINGSGTTVLYGVFRGDQVSTINVSIAEEVQSVTLSLDDAYDGNSSTQMSVSMTPVTSCANGGGAPIDDSGFQSGFQSGVQPGVQPGVQVAGEVILYPNPTNGDLFVQWENAPAHATIRVYNEIGQSVGAVDVEEVKVARVSLTSYGISGSQLLFVSILADGQRYGMRKVMVKQ